MRDPKRIEPTLDAVREFWEQHPSLRLGQIVTILATVAGKEAFYVEDDDLVKAATVANEPPPSATKTVLHNEKENHQPAG